MKRKKRGGKGRERRRKWEGRKRGRRKKEERGEEEGRKEGNDWKMMVQKHTSQFLGRKSQFILEPNYRGPWPVYMGLGYPRFQCGNRFMAFFMVRKLQFTA